MLNSSMFYGVRLSDDYTYPVEGLEDVHEFVKNLFEEKDSEWDFNELGYIHVHLDDDTFFGIGVDIRSGSISFNPEDIALISDRYLKILKNLPEEIQEKLKDIQPALHFYVGSY